MIVRACRRLGNAQMAHVLCQQISDPVTVVGDLSNGAALERRLDPCAGRHPVTVFGRIAHRVPVDPRIDRRAEVLTAELVVYEDLSARVVVSLDLEVLGFPGGCERAFPLPAIDPVPYGVRLARVLAPDDHRHTGLPDFCLT